jgi:hypothetical protein
MADRPFLKQGEKIVFGVAIVFIILAVIAYIGLEAYRLSSKRPMYVTTTHMDLTPDGQRGSVIFRERGCTACHRAMQNGTNMGLSLDGIGSKRTQEWIGSFLRDPEATYGSATLDHGYPPKEAAYVASLPKEDLAYIAIFLSELRSDRGSSSAPEPPPGRSEFIDKMLSMFAPESWKEKYRDIREKSPDDENRNPADAGVGGTANEGR